GGVDLSLLPLYGKRKEFTEVSRRFIKHRVGVGFATGVGIMRIVEGAVETTAQVGPAAGAGIAPADAVLADDLILTAVTGFHACVLVLITPRPRPCPPFGYFLRRGLVGIILTFLLKR